MTHKALPPNVDRDEQVAVTCWCERTLVTVPISKVRNLETESCGHPECEGWR